MSSNHGLVDALTLHQILIERYSKGEAKRLLKHLTRLSTQLKNTISSEYERVRAVTLARQVEQITKTFLKEYGDDMFVGLKEFGKAESEFARQALLATTAAEVIAPASIRQIQASITKAPMKLISGKTTKKITIDQAVKTFTISRAREIGQIVRDGSLLGRTSNEIVKEVTSLVKNKTTRQAEALVRTSTNHIGSQARSATYKANDDVIIGEEYIATLDSHTTISCSSLDGQIYDIGKGPMPPIHWNCRSVRSPKVNPEFNLGSEIVGERASIDGPVSGDVTYGGFLKRQNNAVQDEVLGIERAKLFRSGKLSIGKFTDDSGKVYSLKRLRELNPLAFNSASGT